MSREKFNASFSPEEIPPQREWGKVRLDGSNFKDGDERVLIVPFTNQELALIVTAREAQNSLNVDMARASGPERDFYVGCHIPFGYSLLDRRQALRNFRQIASAAEIYLESKPLSDTTRTVIQVVKDNLTPFMPQPPARQ